jgi:hypothetical protein
MAFIVSVIGHKEQALSFANTVSESIRACKERLSASRVAEESHIH